MRKSQSTEKRSISARERLIVRDPLSVNISDQTGQDMFWEY